MTCQIDHELLKANEAAWRALRYVGLQQSYDEDGTLLELRDCAACRSTLCREVSPVRSTTAIDDVFAAVRS